MVRKLLKEEQVIIPHEVDEETRGVLEIFQDLIALLYKHYHTNQQYGDKRGGLNTVQNFKELKRSLSRYHNYPFIQTVMKQIDMLSLELIDRIQAKREVRTDKDDFAQLILKAKEHWMAGDVKAVLAADKIIHAKTQAQLRANKSDKEVFQYRWNPMYIENPLIFQSSNFLETFEKAEMEEVINKDLDEYKYSYLRLPPSKHSDFQFVAYFILELKKDQEPVVLKNRDLRKYFDMAYSSDDYKKLVTDVKEYLSYNNKEKIPLILQQLKKFPEIEKANQAALAKVSSVFRGIPLDGEDEDGPGISVEQAIQRDAQQPYLATAKSFYAAKNFALQKGHLESDDARRSDNGVVLEYALGEGAGILDTMIFGGIFGEGEIVIDPSKAQVVSDEYV